MKSLIFTLLLLASSIDLIAQPTFIQVVAEPDISVFLDGIFKAKTTIELDGAIIENVEPDSHVIKVVKEGYNPQEETIIVKRGEVYVYNVNPAFVPSIKVTQKGNIGQQEIDKQLGRIKIQSLPVGISISIPKLGLNDAKTKDEWEATAIPIGRYLAIYSWKDKTLSDTLDVKSNQLTHLFVNMIRGTIDERSLPILEDIVPPQQEVILEKPLVVESQDSPERDKLELRPFSILYSGATNAPFGVKFQYYKSFGAYASIKTDLGLLENFCIISGGILKSVGSLGALYLGGGINIGYYDGDGWYYRDTPAPELEAGFVIKLGQLAVDLGVGLVVADNIIYDTEEIIDDNSPHLSALLGIGINF